jgi:hypothetical protein
LPSIERWADTVQALVKPGGRVFLRDGHPMMYAMDLDGELRCTFPYFQGAEPVTLDFANSYVGGGAIEHSRSHEWTHSISSVVMALLDRGFTLNELREHRSAEWEAFPTTRVDTDGRYRLPEAQRDLLPLMFTVIATRTA